MTPSEGLPDAVLEALRGDFERRALKPVDAYVARAPEHEDAIRSEYAACAGSARCIGRYELGRLLGEGAQGRVHAAHDTELGRDVAIKLLRGFAPLARARLQREARIASALNEEGLCPILDLVTEDSDLALVMPLLEGEDLEKRLHRHRGTGEPVREAAAALWRTLGSDAATTTSGRSSSVDPTREAASRTASGLVGDMRHALRLCERMARALHAAHELGVVHRDIKPSNVFLRRGTEPVILDFGLAEDDLVRTDPFRVTRSGAPLGTPHYMAPEQVDGQLRDLDRRTDVYALGAVLYELLTLRPPFREDSLTDLYQRIRSGDPRPPSHWNPAIPRDLDSVCLKALQRKKEQRYANALEFAEDLSRVRTLQPTLARPIPRVARALRAARRHPAIAAALAALLVAIAVLTWWRIDRERRQAVRDETFALLLAHRDLDPTERARAIRELTSHPGFLQESVSRLDPADQARFFELCSQQLAADRTSHGVAFLEPFGRIGSTTPVFRLRAPEWQRLSIQIKSFDRPFTPQIELVAVLEEGRSNLAARLPAGQALLPGAYYWIAAGTEASRASLGAQSFEILDRESWTAISDRLPSGASAPDRLRRAALLCVDGLYSEARAELLDLEPASGAEATLRDLLLAVAMTRGRDPEGLSSVLERARASAGS